MDRFKCDKHNIEWIGKCPRCEEEVAELVDNWPKPSKSSMGLMLSDVDMKDANNKVFGTEQKAWEEESIIHKLFKEDDS